MSTVASWNEIAEKVRHHVIKVETPQGHGTGFLCFIHESKGYIGIATACHVTSHAKKWQQPIRMHHYASGEQVLLEQSERFIFQDFRKDSSIILLPPGKLPLPTEIVKVRPIEHRLETGVEVGWLGFPFDLDALCFFSGRISTFLNSRHAYLIDGVAVQGVSGGPVICSHSTEGVQVVGSITAYIGTGEQPGLSVAQDLSHFHEVVGNIRSMDEAREAEASTEATT